MSQVRLLFQPERNRRSEREAFAASLENLKPCQLYRLLLVLKLVGFTAALERGACRMLRRMRARLWVMAYGSHLVTNPAIGKGIRRWEQEKSR